MLNTLCVISALYLFATPSSAEDNSNISSENIVQKQNFGESYTSFKNGKLYVLSQVDEKNQGFVEIDSLVDDLQNSFFATVSEICTFDYIPQSINISVGVVVQVGSTWNIDQDLCKKFADAKNK